MRRERPDAAYQFLQIACLVTYHGVSLSIYLLTLICAVNMIWRKSDLIFWQAVTYLNAMRSGDKPALFPSYPGLNEYT